MRRPLRARLGDCHRPSCRSGDSGGPVFNGNTVFGIVKGSSYRSDGSCAFYFYMSTDCLHEGWRLLAGQPPPLYPPLSYRPLCRRSETAPSPGAAGIRMGQ
jgi:hypothetical protein